MIPPTKATNRRTAHQKYNMFISTPYNSESAAMQMKAMERIVRSQKKSLSVSSANNQRTMDKAPKRNNIS